MKKIVYVAFSAFLIIWMNNCAGYKPIFSSENINFEISEYSIKGNEILGKRIYYKLDNLSKSIKDKVNKRSISLTIDVIKNKIATVNINKKEIIIFLAPYNSYNFPVIGEQIAAVKAVPEKIHE